VELHVWLAFVIATAILILTPGPSVLLTVGHSISFGWRRGLYTVGGATLGVAVQLVIAAIGLASLLNAVAGALNWIRLLGAAYLIYLGVKQWRSAKVPVELAATEASESNLFIQGLVTTIPNPKSLIFIAAFLPQFIDPARPLGLQFSIIVPTFLVITFVITAIWAMVAGRARQFIQSREAFKTAMKATGGLMIFAGVGLALACRSS